MTVLLAPIVESLAGAAMVTAAAAAIITAGNWLTSRHVDHMVDTATDAGIIPPPPTDPPTPERVIDVDLCPTCDGTGLVTIHPFGNRRAATVTVTCHTCDGQGVTW